MIQTTELEEIIESLEYSIERAKDIHLTRQQYKKLLRALKEYTEMQREDNKLVLKKE